MCMCTEDSSKIVAVYQDRLSGSYSWVSTVYDPTWKSRLKVTLVSPVTELCLHASNSYRHFCQNFHVDIWNRCPKIDTFAIIVCATPEAFWRVEAFLISQFYAGYVHSVVYYSWLWDYLGLSRIWLSQSRARCWCWNWCWPWFLAACKDSTMSGVSAKY